MTTLIKDFEDRATAALKTDPILQALEADITQLHAQLDAKEQLVAEREDEILAAIKKEMSITQTAGVEQDREERHLGVMSLA